MDLIPVAVFWGLAVWAFFGRGRRLLYLFFATMPFGAFAAIPTALTGGFTLTPTPLVAVLMVARQFASRAERAQGLDLVLRPSRLLLLFLFWLLAIATTFAMPRLFSGAVTVVPVKMTDFMMTAPLAVTPQNLSQALYLTISVLTVLAFARMLRTVPMRQHALQALCLGAALTVLTGVLDFASLFLPLDPVLEPFRTATYALLTGVELQDGKRIVGLMPEASSFGGVALTFLVSLYFLRRAMPAGMLRQRVVPPLLLLLLLLVWLSTSSAAYMGMAVFACTVLAEWAWRAVQARGNAWLHRGLSREFAIGAGVLFAMLLVAVAFPRLLDPVMRQIDEFVLQKSASSSFEERSMWTRVSWEALVTTGGLGVGLGGTRASNFAVALASNTGLAAACLYFAFAAQSLLRRAPVCDGQGQALVLGVRWAYAAPFVTSLMVGTTPDFGLFNAFLYGLPAAVAGTAFALRAEVRRDSPHFAALRNAHGT
ncbi:MAG: hypothetical protein QM586_17695 [Xenophilus sp.]